VALLDTLSTRVPLVEKLGRLVPLPPYPPLALPLGKLDVVPLSLLPLLLPLASPDALQLAECPIDVLPLALTVGLAVPTTFVGVGESEGEGVAVHTLKVPLADAEGALDPLFLLALALAVLALDPLLLPLTTPLPVKDTVPDPVPVGHRVAPPIIPPLCVALKLPHPDPLPTSDALGREVRVKVGKASVPVGHSDWVAYPERLASPLTLPPFIVGLGDRDTPLDTLPPPSPLPLTE